MITNPVKAIRAKCLDCSCGQNEEVKHCPVESCPLFPFRFGKNPYRKKVEMSEERKQMMAEILKKARENKESI